MKNSLKSETLEYGVVMEFAECGDMRKFLSKNSHSNPQNNKLWKTLLPMTKPFFRQLYYAQRIRKNELQIKNLETIISTTFMVLYPQYQINLTKSAVKENPELPLSNVKRCYSIMKSGLELFEAENAKIPELNKKKLINLRD
ncbi:hypothetical protein G9A89_022391 [Geosiphon pyriformis]|nr:hypothetical protein G9A89_022391 [Geosiphon pyriformis]